MSSRESVPVCFGLKKKSYKNLHFTLLCFNSKTINRFPSSKICVWSEGTDKNLLSLIFFNHSLRFLLFFFVTVFFCRFIFLCMSCWWYVHIYVVFWYFEWCGDWDCNRFRRLYKIFKKKTIFSTGDIVKL